MDPTSNRSQAGIKQTTLFVVVMAAACTHRAPPPLPSPEGVVLIDVSNSTNEDVGVYFIERKYHARLGTARPRSDTTLTVQTWMLEGRRQFRVYAFRGIEGCPVGRLINLDATPRPRITVAMSDTASHYLPGDACSKR